jgi:hypothetical protein
MPRQVNVLFINGWGGDATSFTLAQMRNDVIAKFGLSIYCPPPVNHQETGLILRYMAKWRDDQILVGLSCGCSTINEIIKQTPTGERIPYAMYLSPSVYCGIGSRPVLPIVLRAQEVNSWALDIFNPGARQLIVKSPGNHITTLLPRLKTSNAHGFTPNNPQARALLKTEIERAIG